VAGQSRQVKTVGLPRPWRDKPGRSKWQYQLGSGVTNQVFCVGIIIQGKREVPVPGRRRSLAGAGHGAGGGAGDR
jgi:hypothetical protein